jgi:hypothetical protein
MNECRLVKMMNMHTCMLDEYMYMSFVYMYMTHCCKWGKNVVDAPDVAYDGHRSGCPKFCKISDYERLCDGFSGIQAQRCLCLSEGPGGGVKRSGVAKHNT